MFRPRIIPVLLLQGQGLVKTIAFKQGKYIGDPINAVRIFNDLKADELVFLDILASKQQRLISLDFVADVGAEANMPFAVGGGIQTLKNIQDIIAAGAEKAIINTHAINKPEFIKQAASHFGSSTITVCMDVKSTWMSGKKVWAHINKKSCNYTPVDYAKLIEEQGAGELIVQSVDYDGQMQGYDIELIKSISESVSIPVVALGGAGNISHLISAYKEGFASAVASGSLFVYQSARRGVLINYPSSSEIQTLF